MWIGGATAGPLASLNGYTSSFLSYAAHLRCSFLISATDCTVSDADIRNTCSAARRPCSSRLSEARRRE